MHIRRLIHTSCTAAITAAALTPYAGAAGAQAGHDNRPVSGLTPVERVIRQENARRNDPRIFGTHASDVARPVVEIVAPGGFRWADAGVGFGAATGLAVAAAGGLILVRGRRLQRA